MKRTPFSPKRRSPRRGQRPYSMPMGLGFVRTLQSADVTRVTRSMSLHSLGSSHGSTQTPPMSPRSSNPSSDPPEVIVTIESSEDDEDTLFVGDGPGSDLDVNSDHDDSTSDLDNASRAKSGGYESTAVSQGQLTPAEFGVSNESFQRSFSHFTYKTGRLGSASSAITKDSRGSGNVGPGQDQIVYAVDDESDEDDAVPDEEDMLEDLELLRQEKKVLERRKARGKVSASVEKRLASLSDKILKLSQQLGLEDNDKSENSEPEVVEIPSIPETQTQHATGRRGFHGVPRFTSNTTNGLKRKRAASRKSPAQQPNKKAATRTSKKDDETTQEFLGMLVDDDPIAARAQMGKNLQTFHSFEAQHWGTQEKQLRLARKTDPTIDKQRYKKDLELLAKARLAFGTSNWTVEGVNWKIKGLRSPLMPYQFAAAGWMLTRERQNPTAPSGILADSVGLGKTIQTLACIIGNPPSTEDIAARRTTTLVVAPANAVRVWLDELAKHTERLHYGKYYSSRQNRMKSHDIERLHVVVVSYHELIKELADKVFMGELDAENKSAEETLSKEERNHLIREASGELFKPSYYRVILDEAHAIKNHLTRTSQACRVLMSRYRWALTATPIHNNLTELFPYFNFIGIPGSENLRAFKKNFGTARKGESINQKLVQTMKSMMMKRSIQTVFLGKAIFDIPNTHPLPHHIIDLSTEEQFIYRCIEGKLRDEFNDELKKKVVMSLGNLVRFREKALRLRMATAHPFLLESVMWDTFSVKDINRLKQQIAEFRNKARKPFIAQMQRWCAKLLQNCSKKLAISENPVNPNGSYASTPFDMESQLSYMEEMMSTEGSMCVICRRPAVNPGRAMCSHVACHSCMMRHLERNIGKSVCPICGVDINVNQFLETVTKTADSVRKNISNNQVRRSPKGSHELGDDANGFQPLGNLKNANFLDLSDKSDQMLLAPSAKTTVVRDIILEWQQTYPDDKIIVFTQWIMAGRILGRILQQENIRFLYLFGGMLQGDKEDQLKDFREDPSIKVMVASLMCAGQSLNLQCANRIILIDLWWHEGLETQAFGRVFRYGQTKETYYVRLLARNTIDFRLLEKQEQKKNQIRKAITEFDSTKVELTVEDVATLFGRLVTDENGNRYIEADYHEDDEDTDNNKDDDDSDGDYQESD